MFGTILAAALAVSSLLPSLPTPAASFDTGTIHVDRYGSGGKALVFIPGLGSGPWSWSEQIARFSKDNTVYAVTLDGFDGQTYTAKADLFTAFASDFWTFLDAQHIQKPVVIGHSLGGTLAIYLGEAHPERLAGIVALDGLPVFPTAAMSTASQRHATAQQMTAAIAGESHAQLLDYDRGYMKQIGTTQEALIEPAAQELAKSDPRAVAAWAAVDVENDLRPALAKATLPMLELMPYSQPSPYTKEQTVAFYTMLLSGAPHATVVPVDGARHFAMLDRPQAVDDAITQFLQRVP